jgi:glycosyltransferase involved in cell wall biosynthesis
MKCGIITPIGPGHELASQASKLSVELAIQQGMGPFDEILFCPVDDTEGKLGRSRARNEGITAASQAGCEWLYFLDADDLMFADAFQNLGDAVDHYDAIWGLICEAPHDNLSAVKVRDRQIRSITSVDQVLNTDPFLTLQMGVFVKTQIAMDYLFDEAMDTGEDFKFYLSLWAQHRCVKLEQIFFCESEGQSFNRTPLSEWHDVARSGRRAATHVPPHPLSCVTMFSKINY